MQTRVSDASPADTGMGLPTVAMTISTVFQVPSEHVRDGCAHINVKPSVTENARSILIPRARTDNTRVLHLDSPFKPSFRRVLNFMNDGGMLANRHQANYFRQLDSYTHTSALRCTLIYYLATRRPVEH